MTFKKWFERNQTHFNTEDESLMLLTLKQAAYQKGFTTGDFKIDFINDVLLPHNASDIDISYLTDDDSSREPFGIYQRDNDTRIGTLEVEDEDLVLLTFDYDFIQSLNIESDALRIDMGFTINIATDPMEKCIETFNALHDVVFNHTFLGMTIHQLDEICMQNADIKELNLNTYEEQNDTIFMVKDKSFMVSIAQKKTKRKQTKNDTPFVTMTYDTKNNKSNKMCHNDIATALTFAVNLH